MSASEDLITVYRSMDATAKEDGEIIVGLLANNGISAVLLNDEAPGVMEGTYEVRVPAAQATQADQLIAENPLADEVEEVDDSENLDLVTIYQSGAAMGELQALGIKSLLESNGIAAVMVGDSVLPNLPFELKVARMNVDAAQKLIAETEQANPPELET
jgi:hypothetical protein